MVTLCLLKRIHTTDVVSYAQEWGVWWMYPLSRASPSLPPSHSDASVVKRALCLFINNGSSEVWLGIAWLAGSRKQGWFIWSWRKLCSFPYLWKKHFAELVTDLLKFLFKPFFASPPIQSWLTDRWDLVPARKNRKWDWPKAGSEQDWWSFTR